MDKIHKINWVSCPKCKYKYYVDQQLLIESIPAECPHCRHKFDANANRMRINRNMHD